MYENFKIYHPDGEQLMFLCSKRRFMWYVNRNIAKVWEEDEMTATLTFMPKGYGDPDYMLKPRENRCVVCGVTHSLTSHHVVPVCYRKFLPVRYKDHNSYDVVLLCEDDHHKYETVANRFKAELIKEHVPADIVERNKLIVSGQKKINSILRYSEVIPPDKLLQIQERLQDILIALNMNEADLQMAEPVNLYEYVVRVTDYSELILGWKRHFVDTARPKFLPEWWEVGKVRLANDDKIYRQ